MIMIRLLVSVALACAALASCGGRLQVINAGIDHVRRDVHVIDCRDGQPARLLIDVHCQDGICGVTCAPDRWRP